MGSRGGTGDRWIEAVLGFGAGASLIAAPFLPLVTGYEGIGGGDTASPDAFELSRDLALVPGVGAAWTFVGFGAAVLVITAVRLLVRGPLLRATAILLGAAGISLVALVGGAYWIANFFFYSASGVSPAPGVGFWLIVFGSAGGLAAPLITGPESDSVRRSTAAS